MNGRIIVGVFGALIPSITSACYIRLPNYIFIDNSFGNRKVFRSFKASNKNPKMVLFNRRMFKEKRGRVLPAK